MLPPVSVQAKKRKCPLWTLSARLTLGQGRWAAPETCSAFCRRHCERQELAWWFKYRPQSQADLRLDPILTRWVILDKFLNLSVRQVVTCELDVRLVVRTSGVEWGKALRVGPGTRGSTQWSERPAPGQAPSKCCYACCLISFPHQPAR